jgi:hypothetical protein
MSNAIGRPSIYSNELIAQICGRLVEGESLRAICRDETMPHVGTVMRWLTVHSDFREQYAYAREIQADVLFDEMQEIADTPQVGKETRTTDGEVTVIEGDMLGHRKLRVDTLKWRLGRMSAKKYGDSTTLNAAGKIVVEIKSFSGDSSGETDGV